MFSIFILNVTDPSTFVYREKEMIKAGHRNLRNMEIDVAHDIGKSLTANSTPSAFTTLRIWRSMQPMP